MTILKTNLAIVFIASLCKTPLASRTMRERFDQVICDVHPSELPMEYLEKLVWDKPTGNMVVLNQQKTAGQEISSETAALLGCRAVLSQAVHRLHQVLQNLDLSSVQPDNNSKRRDSLHDLKLAEGIKKTWLEVGEAMTDRTGRFAKNKNLSNEKLWDEYLGGGQLKWLMQSLEMSVTAIRLGDAWGKVEDGTGMSDVLLTSTLRKLDDYLRFLAEVTPANERIGKIHARLSATLGSRI